jgi:hypothetical protein
MDKKDYDKQLIKWIKIHYWDSLEKDKHLILRHLRTFTGDIVTEQCEHEYCFKCRHGKAT